MELHVSFKNSRKICIKSGVFKIWNSKFKAKINDKELGRRPSLSVNSSLMKNS